MPEPRDLERDAVIAEVYDAFRDVTREGGVSWSQSVVEDDCGTDEERARARSLDVEACWQDLVDDPKWEIQRGVGGFSFLDPIGFRYYLPAAMIRCAKSGADEGISFQLTLPRWFLRKLTTNQWSLLTESQRSCVRRFIEFMIADCDRFDPIRGAKSWDKAYRSYWRNVGRGSK
jgi:hypothetical protein